MSRPQTGQKQPHISKRLKIWFVFLLIFIPAYTAICYGYYLFRVNNELEILTTRLTHQIDGIIATIDVENFKALYEQEIAKNKNCPPKPQTSFDDAKNGYFPEDNPLFHEHMEWVKKIAALEPEQSIHTYVMGPEKNYVVIISSSWYFTNHDESFKFCQLYKAPNMYKGLFKRVDIWTPYHNEYGDWITTSIPIKDKNGEIVGAISVNIPTPQITTIQDNLLLVTAAIFLGIVLVSFGIMHNLTKAILKPLNRLTALTSSIKDTATAIDFSGFKTHKSRWRDETDILSDAIQGMISRLNKQTAEIAQSRAAMQELAHGVIRAQENERKYISRELHGEVGQLLAMLKTSLEDILLDIPEDQETESSGTSHSTPRERLSHAAKQIEKTLGAVRAISHQMRPSLLDVGDVNLALSDYCGEFSQQQKIEVFYEGFIIPNPSEEVAVSFYRFLQEALTNVSKHSSATKILVRAQMDADWIQISVEDNGSENKSTPASKGIGIAGLKERFFLLGGIVEASPIRGGFLVVARAPLTRE
jgi:signal transduction histidine kinase